MAVCKIVIFCVIGQLRWLIAKLLHYSLSTTEIDVFPMNSAKSLNQERNPCFKVQLLFIFWSESIAPVEPSG